MSPVPRGIDQRLYAYALPLYKVSKFHGFIETDGLSCGNPHGPIGYGYIHRSIGLELSEIRGIRCDSLIRVWPGDGAAARREGGGGGGGSGRAGRSE